MIQKSFLGNKRSGKLYYTIGIWLILLGIAAVTYLRLQYSSSFARSWDQVDFALALNRFDLLAMQPHFPGYPYFILGGTIFHQWVTDPNQALAVFNTVMMTSACLPIYFLAKRHLSTLSSLLSCTAVQSLAYFWIMATESMSEASALSVLWWYLWSLQAAKEKRTFQSTLLPLFLFSLLMGIRLSYVTFGIGIILLILSQRKRFQTNSDFYRYAVKVFMFTIAFQFIWIIGLAVTEGSILNFLSLSLNFVIGHFNEWGGAVTAESTPLLNRLFTLVFYNIIWVGICGTSIYGAFFACMLFLILLTNLFRKRLFLSCFTNNYFIMISSYFLWALFAQNIEKPRHALPLIALLTFFLVLGVLKSSRQKLSLIVVILFVMIQSLNGYQLIKEKAANVPASYQLAQYLNQKDEPFVLYTWEEARVMDYLKVHYPYTRLLTYEYFMSDKSQRGDKKIFLTDHVLEGFRLQGIDVENKVKEVKTFVSNPTFDPVYHRIILYEWIQ